VQILKWNPHPGTDEEAYAYIEVDTFSGALIFVRLFGELAEAGLDPQDPASYTDVMKNRAYCSGRYGQGMVWTEFGYFRRPDFAELPSLLEGAWKPKSTSVAYGMNAGDEWECTNAGKRSDVSAPSALFSFESTFILVSGSGARVTSGGESLRVTVPAESQRLRFVSWDPDSGVLMTVNSATEAVRCFLLVVEGESSSSSTALTTPPKSFAMYTMDLSTGAAAGLETDGVVPLPLASSPAALLPSLTNPCDAISYSAATLVDGGVCMLRENEDLDGAESDDETGDTVDTGTFSYGIQRSEMVSAGAPSVLARLLSPSAVLSVSVVLTLALIHASDG
jgi:hypothetical protein